MGFISKLLTFYLNIARFFTFSADNTANMYFEARKLVKEERFDIIIATGEPFFVFRYAYKLSHEFNIPWIADYRDGWSSNIGKNNFSFIKKLVDKLFFLPIEKHVVSSASCITTVALSLKDELHQMLPQKKIAIVPNGYNPEEFLGLETIIQRTDCFEIAYAGIVYSYMPVEIFLQGYRQFIQETGCTNTRVIFYGIDFYPENKDRVLNFDASLNKFIVTTSRLPRTEIFKELSKAHILLLLANSSIDGSCTKIFEYLRLNREIILVVNEHRTLNKLMDECNGGIKCESKMDVVKGLKKCYEEFKQTKIVNHHSVNYEQYSRIKQTELFAKLIRECVA
jgi:glycosyltransferase involved in cell wall biosynthesis